MIWTVTLQRLSPATDMRKGTAGKERRFIKRIRRRRHIFALKSACTYVLMSKSNT